LLLTRLLEVVVLTQQILICQQNHLSVRLALAVKPVTSALIVTSLAVPIMCVMGCARLAAVVGYV